MVTRKRFLGDGNHSSYSVACSRYVVAIICTPRRKVHVARSWDSPPASLCKAEQKQHDLLVYFSHSLSNLEAVGKHVQFLA